MLALASGLRRGELIGLKWQDINFPTGMLQVRRILTRVPSKLPGKGYVEAEPKTDKGRRSILLPPFVIEALSVILQVGSFKLRGKRIFRMAPIHHHFELMGWSESKVIVRFWIAALVFALFALTTLKLR